MGIHSPSDGVYMDTQIGRAVLWLTMPALALYDIALSQSAALRALFSAPPPALTRRGDTALHSTPRHRTRCLRKLVT